LRYLFFLTLFLSALLSALAGCSKSKDEIVEAPAQIGQPALWMIENAQGHKGWLFGTIHLLPPDTDWQGPVLDEAMRNSRQLVVEAGGLDDTNAIANIFANLGVRKGLPPLVQRVDPALKPQLKAAITRSKIPPFVLDRMESWAAMLTLAASYGAGMGLDKESGVEQVLIRRYKADERPISGLETITQQLGLFDGLPEKEQRAMLNSVLSGAEGNKDRYEAQFKAWHKGKIEELLKGQDQGILTSPLVRETLLHGRNRNWAIKIDRLITEDRMPFIAVGAAHLPGETGVVALLEAKGLKLTRLQ
jgi:uncharacterized protein